MIADFYLHAKHHKAKVNKKQEGQFKYSNVTQSFTEQRDHGGAGSITQVSQTPSRARPSRRSTLRRNLELRGQGRAPTVTPVSWGSKASRETANQAPIAERLCLTQPRIGFYCCWQKLTAPSQEQLSSSHRLGVRSGLGKDQVFMAVATALIWQSVDLSEAPSFPPP